MKTFWKLSFTLIAIISISTESFAFCITNNVGGCPQTGTGWPTSSATLHSVDFSGTTSGFNTAFQQAATRWNNLSNFTYSSVNTAVDPCSTTTQGLSTHGWRFAATFCDGILLGNATLAVTVTTAVSLNPTVNTIVDADTIVNNAFLFDVHAGNQNGSGAGCAPFIGQPIDFTRVATHELGHVLGLGHVSGTSALMNPVYSECVEAPLADDINGLQALYGGLGITKTLNDFDGDTHADILWRNTSGANTIWQMNGTSLVGGGPLPSVPSDWQVAGVADFGGAGSIGKADILWRNTSGNNVIWLMNGTTPVGSGSLPTIPVSWQVAGTGDFDGDTHADILWRNTSGANVIWLMNGTTIIGGGPLPSVPSDWQVAGVADFGGVNSTGKADILWRNTSGANVIWLMNGTTPVGSGSLPTIPVSWQVAGTGDFDGDTHADILWRNTNGANTIWQMNGTSLAGGGSLPSVPSGWQVAEVADFGGVNSTGKADILWRNTSGANVIWLMNGTTPVGSGSLPTIPTSWQVQPSPGAVPPPPPPPPPTFPNVLGTYTGPGSVTLTRCQPPAQGDPPSNGTRSGNITVTLNSQTGASFSGTYFITATISPSIAFRENGIISSGTVTSTGGVSASFTYEDLINGGFDSSGNGTMTGSLTGNTLQINSTSNDTVGDTCHSVGSFNITLL